MCEWQRHRQRKERIRGARSEWDGTVILPLYSAQPKALFFSFSSNGHNLHTQKKKLAFVCVLCKTGMTVGLSVLSNRLVWQSFWNISRLYRRQTSKIKHTPRILENFSTAFCSKIVYFFFCREKRHIYFSYLPQCCKKSNA